MSTIDRNVIAEMYERKSKNKFFNNKDLSEFMSDSNFSYYVYNNDIDDNIFRIDTVRDAKKLLKKKNTDIIRIIKRPFFSVLNFSMLKDCNDEEFDLKINCHLSITNYENAIKDTYTYLDIEKEFTRDTLTQIIITKLRTFVLMVCKKHSFNYYRNEEGYNCDMMVIDLNNALLMNYLEVSSVITQKWESFSLDQKKEIERQENEFNAKEKIIEQQRAAELKEKQLNSMYKNETVKIEHDNMLLDEEKNYKLEVARQNRELSKIEFEKNKLKVAFEIKKIENLGELAKAKAEKDMEEIKKLNDDLKSERKKTKDIQQLYDKAMDELRKELSSLKDAIIITKNTCKPVINAVRLASESAQLSSKTLELIGEENTNMYLSRKFKEVSRKYPDKIKLSNKAISTRDLSPKITDGKKGKFDYIRIGDVLDFTIKSNTSGYLTLINIGTSGKILIMTPNYHVHPNECKIKRGRRYVVPHDGFLPDYIELQEIGPAGNWDEIFGIVTDQPIIPEFLVVNSKPNDPFPQLKGTVLEDFLEKLDEAFAEKLYVGYLSFYVDEPK